MTIVFIIWLNEIREKKKIRSGASSAFILTTKKKKYFEGRGLIKINLFTKKIPKNEFFRKILNLHIKAPLSQTRFSRIAKDVITVHRLKLTSS